jgi:hypothetical protein
MKKLLLLIPFVIISLQSCEKGCNTSSYPAAPHGTADDVTTYDSDGYRSIDYTYYCLNGQYVSITYSSYQGDCWEESEFTSSGICATNELTN